MKKNDFHMKSTNEIKPFLKWAGGKNWFIKKIDRYLPDSFANYYEPFLGGGSMFFHLKPETAFLSDINSDLINAYVVIRDNWEELYGILNDYNEKHSKEFYYKVRASNPNTKILMAARFIYLNRTCWNGLYRVNKNGDFNVPIGTKKNVVLDTDDFEKLSYILKKAHINSCDFEETINRAGQNDFIFVDPPYTVKHNLNGFIKYNENIFSWKDQQRLKLSISSAIERGAFVLITNAYHNSIEELYTDIGNMNLLERPSVIAGNPEARGIFNELVIKSWE